MGACIRAYDWSRTALGPAETWPQSLRTTVSTCVSSGFPTLIWWGPDFIKIYNDAYRDIIGDKHPRALGAPGAQIWPDLWDFVGPILEGVLIDGETALAEDQRFTLHRHGYAEECYFSFSYSPIRDETGGIGGVFCPVMETTERVLSERRLRLQGALAERMVEARSAMEVCAIATACIGTFGAADFPFASIYLASDEQQGGEQQGRARLAGAIGVEACPETIALDIPADPESPGDIPDRAVLPLRAGGGRVLGVIIVGLNPQRPHAETMAAARAVAGQIAAAIANAQTFEDEHRRAEALAAIDRAKTAFFSNVSHEFRTPLTLMLGPLAEILGGRPGDDAARDHALVKIAHRNGLRLLKLVNTLLDFSRIEAGRMQAAYAPVDLAQLTAELASNFRAACEMAGLNFAVECPPLGEPVYVDRDMWEKIVLNLVSNAFKFTLKGSIAVSLRRIGSDAALSVRDTGIGIPASALPRLFERFHRVQGASGRTHEGSGIGLSLVRELAALHGGTVEVDSAPGRGSTFTVVIPLGISHLPPDQIQAPPAEAGNRTAASFAGAEATQWLGADDPPALPELEGERATILLVDDNADMRNYVRRLLRQRYEVHTATDGEAALSAIRELRPDLVLSDVMMPRLDGFALVRAIRSDPALADLPIVLLSARAGEDASIEGLETGADDYLIKPFSARELAARVSSALDRARLRSQERSARAALRESQHLLAEERAHLATLIENLPVGVCFLGPDGEPLLSNPAFRRFIPADLIPSRLPDGEERWRAIDADGGRLKRDRYVAVRALKGEIVPGIEYLYRPIDGPEIWTLVSGLPLRNPEGEITGALIVIADIDQQKRAQEALLRLNETLEQRIDAATAEHEAALAKVHEMQKLETIGKLTGGLAHDFNNLLTPIVGSLDLIRRRYPADERSTRMVTRAMQSAERARLLVQRLLAFARRQHLEASPVDLSALVAGMDDLIESSLGPQVRVRKELPPDLPPAMVDPHQLELALLNLAVNARDAMPDGGAMTISGDVIDISAKRPNGLAPGRYVRLSVIDTGAGMTPETLARAIEPFFSTKEVGRGTGLGLSMVHGLAAQSGGQLTLKSAPGEGATATLWLPCAQAPAQAKSAQEASADSIDRRLSILVVDDEEIVRLITAEILAAQGHDVVQADSGRAALELVTGSAAFDLMLVDYMMPGMNGIDLIRRARATRPALPAILISGYANISDEEIQELPRLAKPFRAADLERIIAETLA